jgi:hypothetical protein
MTVQTKSRDFRELKVWAKAHRLTLDAYASSRTFPKEEAFGLTSQIRRAAPSIPTNIAEDVDEAAATCHVSVELRLAQRASSGITSYSLATSATSTVKRIPGSMDKPRKFSACSPYSSIGCRSNTTAKTLTSNT